MDRLVNRQSSITEYTTDGVDTYIYKQLKVRYIEIKMSSYTYMVERWVDRPDRCVERQDRWADREDRYIDSV